MLAMDGDRRMEAVSVTVAVMDVPLAAAHMAECEPLVAIGGQGWWLVVDGPTGYQWEVE